MKKFIIPTIVLACGFMSCSKDDENDISLVSENDIEVYQKTFDDAVSFMEKNSSISLEDAANYMETLDGVINVSVEDSLIRVSTQGDVCFSIDFYEQPENYEIDNVTESSLQAYIDSIDNATGYNPAKGYEQTSEVFEEYLSTLTRSVEELPITRTTSSSDFVRLSRRNAAIWAPLKGDYEKEANEIIKIANSVLGKEGKEIKVLNGYSPSVFSSFKDYDVVYMSYHGDKGGVISIPVKLLSQKEKEEYKNELKYKRVQGRIKVKDPQKQIVRYILLDSFWEHYLSNLDKTILFSCVCNLGENNSSFLKVCTRSNVNVADFFASDDECRAKKIVNCFKEFYPLLMRGNCSSKAAFKPFQDFFFYEGKGYTFNYKRFGGSKIVYYPIAHATGVGNRTNSNKAKTRGSDDTNSSIVVSAQLRYATEESDDILKSIEAGVCLQDMETKEVTLVPFSDKNIVSNEKKKYGDVTVSNIAVSLDELTSNHQYAYCCYTKVDGQITLSDECYYINISGNFCISFDLKIHCESTEEYEGAYEYDSHDFDGSLDIYKVRNNYYLSKHHLLEWIQNPIYTNTTKEYTLIRQNRQRKDYEYIDIKVTCSWDLDNLYIKIEYNDHGYSWYYNPNSGTEELAINNIDSNPSISYSANTYSRPSAHNITSKYTLSSVEYHKSILSSFDNLDWYEQNGYKLLNE